MGNKSILEKSYKEIATEIFFGPVVDLEKKIKKTTDIAVVNELLYLALQRDRIDVRKIAEARLKELA